MQTLVLMYVGERLAGGHIGRRSAESLRSRLWDFARHVPETPGRVRRQHVERWMQRPDLSPQYLRARLSTVRGFVKWCVANGHMRTDITLTVQAPRVPESVPKRMTRNEALRLVAVAREDSRTLLIVLLSLQEALRREEISRLNVEDFDFAERTVVIHGKGGKGGATDVLPLSDETWAALIAYLAVGGHQHGPLVRSRVRKHDRLAPPTISELVRQAMIEAGIKQPGDQSRTPHSTRHTAAHDLMTRTENVRAVQQALRHRSVRSTEVYLRGHVSPLREIMGGRTYLAAPDATPERLNGHDLSPHAQKRPRR